MEKSQTGTVIGGRLNLREKPSIQSRRLALIPDDAQITVSEYDTQWCRAQYNGLDGYVMKQFVQLLPSLPSTWSYGKVTADPLNVRRRPSTSGARWNSPWPKGRIALIKPCTDGWYQTLYRGETAYVSAQYVLPLTVNVSDSLVDRMLYMAPPEIGQSNSRFFNGYTGAWCHRFADWLAMHAGLLKDLIPNTSGCGKGIVWFATDAKSGGFFFKNAEHKKRIMRKYAALKGLDAGLTAAERDYGRRLLSRWASLPHRADRAPLVLSIPLQTFDTSFTALWLNLQRCALSFCLWRSLPQQALKRSTKGGSTMKRLIPILLVLTLLAPVGILAQGEITEEQAVVLSAWANDLYEPETTITYAPTIAWPADTTAVETADKPVRPNSMFVTIDKDLRVYAMDGTEISDNLGAYLAQVKDTTLAALYINDQETADAFSAFAGKYAVADVLVVAKPENARFVKMICDANVGILGIIDWSDTALTTERADLLKVVQQTNAAHAKIALIPESIATYDAVEYLRGMLITVWAKTTADADAIFTQLTNGVNGIVCADYSAVAAAISSVNDVTTLMRHVFIAGHRGMPGAGYVENTIRSGRAAIEAGANVIECDVGLSADGELFILHDDTTTRLFNRPEGEWAESLTIAELTSLVYDVTDDTKENAPNSLLNANNTNRNTEGREDYVLNYDPAMDRIPTLREYWESLGDENIIHFVEIKSYQPAIVEPLKKLAKEMGIEDRLCIITFNDGIDHFGEGAYDPATNVMAEMFKTWPEMSLGYLGMSYYNWGKLDEVAAEKGIGAAVGQLYGFLQPYNSTCNDINSGAYRDVMFAARHRGLTGWHWTYNTEAQFADHYLSGGTYSMTTNFSNWASGWAVRLVAEDQTLANGEELAVKVISQQGDELTDAGKLSLVPVSGVPVKLEDGKLVAQETGTAVVMVRLDAKLDVNGVDVSEVTSTDYAIYSAPITITVK